MNKASDIRNRNGIKGIYTLEPITIKIEHFFIKRWIISESPFDIERLEISCHCLRDISEFVHSNHTGTHGLYINGPLIRIISWRKSHWIVPHLFYNKFPLDKRFPAFAIGNKIADIIAERLLKGSRFRVENTNIHFSISNQNYYKGLPSFSLHYLLYQIFRKSQELFSKNKN